MKFISKAAFLCSFLLISAGCANKPHIVYSPNPQKAPQHVKKIAVKQFVNKTKYFGLEERLTLQVIDEFLRNATYPIVSFDKADAVIEGQINRYILTPVQYDTALVPSVYKLTVLAEVSFYDVSSGKYLWQEPALEAVQIYSAPTLSGGMTEDQARALIWDTLSKDIVTRTIEGFGTVTSQSERKISPTNPTHTD